MFIFLVPFAFCALILLYQLAFAVPKRKRQREEMLLREAERKEGASHDRSFRNASLRGSEAQKSATAYQYLDQMKDDYYGYLKENASPVSRSCYQDDIKELQEYAKDLEKDEWEAKSRKTLDEFLENYLIVTSVDFSDVDRITRAKNRCIELWQRYMALPEGHRALLYPKVFLRDYLGDDYDPCMESSETLRKKLESSIAEHRPEQRRKLKLYRLMLDYIEENASVQRSRFLCVPFDGYSPDEIKCCYKDLVSQNRLAEIKMGNRYFVCLSDKEAKKRDKKTAAAGK